MRIPERFEQIKGNQEICSTGYNERPVQAVNPDMGLDRPPALGHTMGLGTFHVPVFEKTCLTEDIGGKNGSLSTYTHDQDIETFCHFFASRDIAPTGQIRTQTAHPLQSSVIRAFLSMISIAGHPNRTHVPQPVQVSGFTA